MLSGIFLILFQIILPIVVGASNTNLVSLGADATGKILSIISQENTIRLSKDRGITWIDSVVSSCLECNKWQFIAMSKDASKIAVTGAGNSIFTSADFGGTWAQSNAPIKHWNSFSMSKSGEHMVATALLDGVYLSNGGAEWLKVENLPELAWQKAVMNGNGEEVVAVSLEGKIYLSRDFGKTWVESFSRAEYGWIDVSVNDKGDQVVAVSLEGSIFQSVDFGASWSFLFRADVSWSAIASDNEGKNLLAASLDQGVYISHDYGKKWTASSAPLFQWNMLASDSTGEYLLAGSNEDKAFFVSNNYGNTWTSIDDNNHNRSPMKSMEADVFSSNAELMFQNMKDMMSGDHDSAFNSATAITSSPTKEPTAEPTKMPSIAPTATPSALPTSQPSGKPSGQPSSVPSAMPSSQPSTVPSGQPSGQPSSQPSSQPSGQPSSVPSTMPSSVPSNKPSGQPSSQPSGQPSSQPSSQPSEQPSGQPSSQPSSQPSAPSFAPSTLVPTAVPSIEPTIQPSAGPTYTPTVVPTTEPSMKPSMSPDALSYYPSYAPTFIPTEVPSAAPTVIPTSAPTHIPLPGTNLTITNRTTSSVVLFVSFDKPATFYGMAYCAITTSPIVDTSTLIDYIYINGQSISYPTNAMNASLSFTSLIPLSSYTAYCWLRDFQGYGNTLTQVVESKLKFTTPCCKEIVTTTIPPYLFNDPTYYTSGKVTGNVITYQLNYYPKHQITVNPQFHANGVLLSSTDAKISPLTQTFTNTSASLSSSFTILLSSNVIANEVTVSMNITGLSATEYISFHKNISIVTVDKVPPPNFISAQFSNTGLMSYLTLDSSVDSSLMISGTWSCNSLFIFTGANKANCIWFNSTVVYATLSTNTADYLLVGDKITYLGNKMKAQCQSTDLICSSYAYGTNQTVSLLAPVSPTIPTVSIVIPASISSCSNVTINPTSTGGNAGRIWKKAKWSITALDGSDVSIAQTFLTANNGKTSSALTLDRKWFSLTTYYVTLSVTNFLGGKSSSTVSFTMTDNSNIPSLSILGPSIVTIKASDSLSLLSKVSLSTCSSSSASLIYTWTVLSNDGTNTGLISNSKNPAMFQLNGNKLQSGKVYTVKLDVSLPATTLSLSASSSTSITVQVQNGAIVANIAGGGNRLIVQDVTLDASSSIDENTGTNVGLQYNWNCKYGGTTNYGSSCNDVLTTVSRISSTLLIKQSLLNASYIYNFGIQVTSIDGRIGTNSVIITTIVKPSDTPTTRIAVSVSSSRLNVGGIAVIGSTITSTGIVLAKWSAYVNNLPYSLASATTASIAFERNITASTNGLAFPIIVSGDYFPVGSKVTFRLAIAYRGVMLAYSEASIIINGPPTDGSLVIGKKALDNTIDFTLNANGTVMGTALKSIFVFQGLNWIDDADSLPISYDFHYLLTSDAKTLIIQSKSIDNTAETSLPQGLYARNYVISVIMKVYDVWQATTSVTGIVQSLPNIDTTATNSFLTNALTNFNKTKDTTVLLSSTNTAATQYNAVNCTLAPPSYCANLNRGYCSNIPQTCAACLTNYTGVFGPSNHPCVKITSTITKTGECVQNSDCTYGLCVNAKCQIPSKTCPSSISGLDCSGHGTCAYSSGPMTLTSSECLITNVFCKTTCTCDSGYGGSDCSLTTLELLERQGARVNMCKAVALVLQSSDVSPSLMEGLAAALAEVYNPNEIVTAAGRQVCLSVLEILLSEVQAGYVSVSAAQTFVSIISDFVVYGNSTYTNDLTLALFEGLNQVLVDGEIPRSFDSDASKMIVNRDLVVGSTGNYTITVPQSTEEAAYDTPTTTIQFADGVAQYCDSGNGYMSLSVSSYTTIPYENAATFISQLSETRSYGSNNLTSSFVVSTIPAYYITIPLQNQQRFGTYGSPRSNETYPECKNYVNGKLISCGTCDVYSYSNHTVTFGCYDIRDLCGGHSGTSGRRRLQSGSTSATTSSQLGSGLSNIYSPIIFDISTDSFHSLNSSAIKGVIAFISTIVFLLLVGCCIFRRWDHRDHIRKTYGIAKTLPSDNNAQDIGLDDIAFNTSGDDLGKGKHGVSSNFQQHCNTIFTAIIPLSIFETTNYSTYYIFHRLIGSFTDYTIYAQLFGRKSSAENRTTRWIGLIGNILILLFLNAVFFGIYFPDDGTCEGYNTIDTCLSRQNKIVSQTLCHWKIQSSTQIINNHVYVDATCEINTPPTDITFILAASTIVLLIAIPIISILEYIRVEIVAKRPEIEQLGITTGGWLGYNPSNDPAVVAKRIFAMNSSSDSNNDHRSSSSSSASRRGSKLLSVENNSNGSSWNADFLARTRFYDVASISEEVYHIVTTVQQYFVSPSHCGVLRGYDKDYMTAHEAKKLAIKNELHLNVDGAVDVNSLGCLQSYGGNPSNVSEVNTIEKVITTSRNKTSNLLDNITHTRVMNLDDLEIRLAQEFILEQMSPIQQFALRYSIFHLPFLSFATINPYIWLLGSIVLLAVYGFCFAWTLTWCITSGNLILGPWGYHFALAFIQDIILIQIFQTIFVYEASIALVKPQLNHICAVMNNVCNRLEHQENYLNHSYEWESRLNEIRVMQYTSPILRIARHELLSTLRISKLFHFLDDADIYACRRTIHPTTTGTTTATWQMLLTSFFIIPAYLQMYLHSLFGDMYLAALFPSIISGLILAFYHIFQASWIAFTVIVVILFVVLVVFTLSSIPITASFLQTIQTTLYNAVNPWYHCIRISWVGRSCSTTITFLQTNLFPSYFSKQYHHQQQRQDQIWQVQNIPKLLQGQILDDSIVAAKDHALFLRAIHQSNKSPQYCYLKERVYSKLTMKLRDRATTFEPHHFAKAYDIHSSALFVQEFDPPYEHLPEPDNQDPTNRIVDRIRSGEFGGTVAKKRPSPPTGTDIINLLSHRGASRIHQYVVSHDTTTSGYDAIVRSMIAILHNTPEATADKDGFQASMTAVQNYLQAATLYEQKNDLNREMETSAQIAIWSQYRTWSLTIVQLEQLVKHIFTLFTPHLHRLTPEEQNEIIEDFRAWYYLRFFANNTDLFYGYHQENNTFEHSDYLDDDKSHSSGGGSSGNGSGTNNMNGPSTGGSLGGFYSQKRRSDRSSHKKIPVHAFLLWCIYMVQTIHHFHGLQGIEDDSEGGTTGINGSSSIMEATSQDKSNSAYGGLGLLSSLSFFDTSHENL